MTAMAPQLLIGLFSSTNFNLSNAYLLRWFTTSEEITIEAHLGSDFLLDNFNLELTFLSVSISMMFIVIIFFFSSLRQTYLSIGVLQFHSATTSFYDNSYLAPINSPLELSRTGHYSLLNYFRVAVNLASIARYILKLKWRRWINYFVGGWVLLVDDTWFM